VVRRARIALLVAIVASVVFVCAEFPFGDLAHTRAAASAAAASLAKLQRENAALGAEVKALENPSQLGRIAEEEYGLVKAGQRAYVILPTGESGRAADDALAAPRLSASSLVAQDPGSTASAPGRGPGIWQQVEGRLEFWRWAF